MKDTKDNAKGENWEITALEIQKKNKQRVSIFLEEQYAFGLDVMTASSLGRGDRLSSERIEELKSEDAFKRAFDAAIRFLGPRARSTKEMSDYLKKKSFSKNIVESVLERLKKDAYLDDGAFARLWVENRLRFNPRGCWMLRQELRQKGVDDSDITDALADMDEEDAAWESVKKKCRLWSSLSKDAVRKKVYTHLASRGFGYEIADSVWRRFVRRNEPSE